MSVAEIDYRELMDRAFRRVIGEALAHAGEHGLVGDSHFFITFRTDYPGVKMPLWLRAEHPENLSVAIQHEYRDLIVADRAFSVTLSFRDRSARLTVPLDAVEVFADPSRQFGLRFPSESEKDKESVAKPVEAKRGKGEALPLDSDNKVVSLDAFRQ